MVERTSTGRSQLQISTAFYKFTRGTFEDTLAQASTFSPWNSNFALHKYKRKKRKVLMCFKETEEKSEDFFQERKLQKENHFK
jgi:hypothetical protein